MNQEYENLQSQIAQVKARCKHLRGEVSEMEEQGRWGAADALRDELSDNEAHLCGLQNQLAEFEV